jgi:3-hydroxyacyl-CoA dehydrogenase
LLHREQLRAIPSLALRVSDSHRIRQVGIIVDGTAGLALYLHSAAADFEVVYRAKDKEALALGMVQVNELLQLELQRGAMTQRQVAKILGGFRGTYTWTHFNKLHLILDASEGTLADKQAFYQEMEKHTTPGAIIVPITSLHRIADLQHGLLRRERMIGLHLIEPWNRGSLAELVAPAPNAQTSAQRVREWLIALGKCCLPVPDCVGGLAMRVWLPALNEAGLLVKEGIPIVRIDQAMHRFGMTYGPLEWMDRLGIDAIASLIKAMQPMFAGRIKFESGFELMVERQWVGNRVERGFYQTGHRKPKPHAAAADHWRTSAGETARPLPTLSEADMHAWIQWRLVTLMVLEAVRCLEEGLATSADDLDCAMCLTGWATHRGGPIGYARQLGVETLTQRCRELAREFGTRFEPIPSLNKVLS